MTAEFNLGNYEIDEDSNGDLVIRDSNDNDVFRWDSTNGKWVMGANAPLDLSELVDGAGVSHTGELADQGDPGPHSTQHEPGGSDEVTDIDINNTGTNVSGHASRHNAGAADEVTVENLGTTGANGEVPTSQGDGTLAMSSPPNTPDWSLDGNSPQTTTSVTSDTYTLAGTYDLVMIHMQVESLSDFSNSLELRANGDSGSNYNYVTTGGTQTTGANSISRIFQLGANQSRTTQIACDGRFNGWSGGQTPPGSSTQVAIGWGNGNITSPLDSLTLFSAGSNQFDITWEVFGRDIGPAGEP